MIISNRKQGNRRRGMAALEVVLTAALTIPMAFILFRMLERTIEQFFVLIAQIVCSFYV